VPAPRAEQAKNVQRTSVKVLLHRRKIHRALKAGVERIDHPQEKSTTWSRSFVSIPDT
jgi:hypothetical protein